MSTKLHKDSLVVEDLLGKDVYDNEGEFVGVSNNLYIDGKKMKILGVAIDKGFIAKGLVIGTSYVERVAKHAIFLNTRPAFRMKGMIVFDKNGAVVGTVVGVTLEEETNDVRTIVVKRWLRKQTIPIEKVEKTKVNVFLNVTKAELKVEKLPTAEE